MNMIGQAWLKFETRGFKERKKAPEMVVRGLGDNDILICINALIHCESIPANFPYPSEECQDPHDLSHSHNKVAKDATPERDKVNISFREY